MKRLVVLVLLIADIASASAAVFRCEQNGKVTYTDQPCSIGATPAPLPAITSVQAERGAPDLTKQYDADEKRGADSRAKADRDWLKKRSHDKTHDDAIRTALVENRVIMGMSPQQVEQVLSAPQSVEGKGGPKERWIYDNGRERRTIAFKDGVVSSNTLRSARK